MAWEVSRGWNRGTNESVTYLEGSNRHGELQWTSLLRYLSRFVPFHFQCPGTRKPRPPRTKVRLRLLVVRVSRSKRTRGARRFPLLFLHRFFPLFCPISSLNSSSSGKLIIRSRVKLIKRSDTMIFETSLSSLIFSLGKHFDNICKTIVRR